MYKHHLKFWILPSLFTIFLVINFILIILSFLSYLNSQYHRTAHLITDTTATIINHPSIPYNQQKHDISHNISFRFSNYPAFSTTLYLDKKQLQNPKILLHKILRKKIMSKISRNNFYVQQLSICYNNEFCANITINASEKFYLYLILTVFAMSLVIMGSCYFFYTQKLINPFLRIKKIANELNIDNKLLPSTNGFNFRNMTQVIRLVSNKLGKLNQDKLRIFAALSHDLKTPITKATLYVKNHLKEKDQHKLQKYFSDMDYLIEQIHVFAKKNYFKEIFQKVNLTDLVESTFNEYKDCGFNVKLQIIETPGIILNIQRKAFKRVLTNLIDNALKYAGNATIILSKNSSNHQITLKVLDNGPGIAQDKIKYIFDQFYRVRNHSFPGSGLGLSIVKEIIEKNNLYIAIENRNDTHGLIVTIFWKIEN